MSGPILVVTPNNEGSYRVVESAPADTGVVTQPPPGSPGTIIPQSYSLVAVSNWTMTHPFPYKPEARVVDSTNHAVLVSVNYPSASQVNISFPVPFTGTVYLS